MDMTAGIGANLSQDASIETALGNMAYNPLFNVDRELADSFDYAKTWNSFYAVATPMHRKSEVLPTTQQLFRIGAKRLNATLATQIK